MSVCSDLMSYCSGPNLVPTKLLGYAINPIRPGGNRICFRTAADLSKLNSNMQLSWPTAFLIEMASQLKNEN
jgi:hypothetical protein